MCLVPISSLPSMSRHSPTALDPLFLAIASLIEGDSRDAGVATRRSPSPEATLSGPEDHILAHVETAIIPAEVSIGSLTYDSSCRVYSCLLMPHSLSFSSQPPHRRAPLPTTLPSEDTISPTLIHLNSYALQRPFSPLLEGQLKALGDWIITPIQLDRDGSFAGGVDILTQQRHIDQTLGFLGFCYQFLKLPINQVDLSLFENPALILSFILFLKVRKCSTLLLTLSDPVTLPSTAERSGLLSISTAPLKHEKSAALLEEPAP